MKGRVFISPRAPLCVTRPFGLVNAGWPRTRRCARPAQSQGPERVFRSSRAPATASGGPGRPIQLNVTNVTVSPYFKLLWSQTVRSEVALQAIAGPGAVSMGSSFPGGVGSEHTPNRRPWTAINWQQLRTVAIFQDAVTPYSTDPNAPSPLYKPNLVKRDQANTERPHASVTPDRKLIEMRHGKQTHLTDRVARQSETRFALVNEATRHLIEMRSQKQRKTIQTTVARRILTWKARHSQSDVTGQHASSGAAGGMSELSVPIRPEVTARLSTTQPRSMAGMFEINASPSSHIRSRPQFRAPPPVPPIPTMEPVAPPPPVAQAPEIDMAKLDKELWRRFEKRIRIEHERRGRG